MDTIELLVSAPTYAREGSLSPEDVEEALVDLVREAFPDVSCRRGDAGWGASWPVFVLVLAGIAFLQGKKIEENLDAWMSLAQRFTGLLGKIRDRLGSGLRVDENGAELIALAHVVETAPQTFERRGRLRVNVVENASLSGEGLEDSPERIYVFVFEIDRRMIHVCGVSASSDILFHHRYASFPPLASPEDAV